MIKVFSPQDALDAKVHVIPDEVIEAVNKLLATRFSGGRCTFTQHEVLKVAKENYVAAGKEVPRDQTFFSEHWMDFEPIYRKAGWKVHYDKPGWDESYEAFFEFSRA